MKKVKVEELVLDFDLYPRTQVDGYHVSQLAEAIRAGSIMPPVVIDKKSRRVVDGFHRVKAASRVNHKGATVEVVEKSYRSDKELFLDAVRYNSGHGRILATYDKTHTLITADRLGIEPESVATALHMTVEAAASLRVDRSATAAGKTLSVQPAIPIKRTIRHMAGRRLTKEQVEANDRLGGMEQLFYVNQIVTLIEAGLVDRQNAELMERLEHLAGLLAELSPATA